MVDFGYDIADYAASTLFLDILRISSACWARRIDEILKSFLTSYQITLPTGILGSLKAVVPF